MVFAGACDSDQALDSVFPVVQFHEELHGLGEIRRFDFEQHVRTIPRERLLRAMQEMEFVPFDIRLDETNVLEAEVVERTNGYAPFDELLGVCSIVRMEAGPAVELQSAYDRDVERRRSGFVG